MVEVCSIYHLSNHNAQAMYKLASRKGMVLTRAERERKKKKRQWVDWHTGMRWTAWVPIRAVPLVQWCSAHRTLLLPRCHIARWTGDIVIRNHRRTHWLQCPIGGVSPVRSREKWQFINLEQEKKKKVFLRHFPKLARCLDVLVLLATVSLSFFSFAFKSNIKSGKNPIMPWWWKFSTWS